MGDTEGRGPAGAPARRASRAGAAGKSTVSIRDVATAAGVSVATVSRALNPETSGAQMRPETRERVLKISAELGYRPNDLARALLQRRTAVIGLVVPDISNPYYAGLVRGVEDLAASTGYRVVLCNTDRSPEKTARYLDTLFKSRADGVIFAGGAAEESLDARSLHQYQTKFVFIGRHDLDQPTVQVDNVAAARNATEYLLDLGHERIAFLGGPPSSHTVQDRAQGYRKALECKGIPSNGGLVRHGEFDERSGYDLTTTMLRDTDGVTAILSANDRVAVGAMAALHDAGFVVPRNMSVIGFDDIPTATYLRPRLTTVAIPTYDIGIAAVRLLLRQFDDIASHRGERNLDGQADTSHRDPATGHNAVQHDDGDSLVLDSSMVVRDSCSIPPQRPE